MSRFFTGIAQGFYIPSASMLIAKWFAEKERSSAMAIFTTGSQVSLLLFDLAYLKFSLVWLFRCFLQPNSAKLIFYMAGRCHL
jgi:sugar phosphate permease